MKKVLISSFLIVLMSIVGVKAYAYDIAVDNADGVTICYNYINDANELEVTSRVPEYYGNVVIPEEVTYMNRTRRVTSIGNNAFYNCVVLQSVTIPNSVTSIGNYAFHNCSFLSLITIPNNVTSIGEYAFFGCSRLTSITIPNGVTSISKKAFSGCSGLTSVTIPSSVTDIGSYAFSNCSDLTSITIPSSVTDIGSYAFSGCSGLTSITIPSSVTSLGEYAFESCSSLALITIGKNVTSIGKGAFAQRDIPIVISLIENPFAIEGIDGGYGVFSQNTFINATLYVPVGTIDKYKATKGWRDFKYIEEGTGEGGGTTPEKCEKPTISYNNGKLTFTSGTEGAAYQYNITDTDVKAGSGNEVQLTVTYSISVYATKDGYDDSETVTATLCWIDVNPKAEGIENSIANIRANPVMIQSNEGVLNISGIDDGTDVVVYSVSGQMIGTSKAKGHQVSVFTNIKKGEIAIVKIGDKSVKVVMQ